MEISKLVEKAGKFQEAKAYCFPELEDEIELAKYSDLSALNESDSKLIFHKCIGHELAWGWSMVNNQGYSDALKLQFQNNVAF
ncbi:DUF6334 family protein [Pseudoalteromonas mariniglutinosa]|uniref:DUF6334 family protein n=1 Tax=Pseudoalteromonas mariniglutinosa TaxID=206042 RepID=UPI0038501233